MTTQNRKKDDELVIWLIVGFIFTGFLIGIDIWYSSFNVMSNAGKIGICIGHGILGLTWGFTLLKFNDPNYDFFRKLVVYLAIILSLIIGIHHATVREDKQVLIDSHENATKDSLK